MDSLKGIISDMKVFYYGGIATLPLTIAGTFLILGLFTANYAMLFFLIGFLIGVPAVASGINLIVDAVFKDSTLFTIRSNDICSLVTPFNTLAANTNASKNEITFCSNGTAMIAFFFGYILTNAVKLYQRPAEADADPALVSNRKMTAVISMACIALFTLVALVYRWNGTCETGLGFTVGVLAFGAAGYGWYTMLSQFGNDRLSDLFGIANRLMVKSAMSEDAMACFST